MVIRSNVTRALISELERVDIVVTVSKVAAKNYNLIVNFQVLKNYKTTRSLHRRIRKIHQKKLSA